MGCKPRPLNYSPRRHSNHGADRPKFVTKGLLEEGRLHFFFHSPCSALPIRDVTGKLGHGNKLEPHIERNAENYCIPCLQRNIVGFLKSKAKYLFLFTRCKNDQLPYYDKRYVVGYIVKQKWLLRRYGDEAHYAVQGPTKLVEFKDAFPLSQLRGSRWRYLRFAKLSSHTTKQILERLGKARNVRQKCLKALKDLEGELRKSEAAYR